MANVDVLHLGKQTGWPRILQELGVDPALLSGRACPCPVCGGRDRFTFEDKTGEGDWVCRGHGIRPGKRAGAGKGINLVMDLYNETFPEAARRVKEAVLGKELPVYKHERHSPQQEISTEDQKRYIAWMMNSSSVSQSGDRVDQYLASRGLSVRSPVLRLHPELNYTREDGTKVKYPALIAPLTSADGRTTTAVHRIWLSKKGAGKAEESGDVKKTFGKGYLGGAVRLYEPENGFLAVAEGVETAEAVRELYGWPVWATLTTGGMESIILPPEVTKVMIMADNDSFKPKQGYCPGIHSARILATRLRAEGRTVQIRMPSQEGWDFLDVLNHQ